MKLNVYLVRGKCSRVYRIILVVLQAQQKSGEEVRAGLQRACEQQIEAVRNRANKQADAHGRCKKALPAALSQTLSQAILSSLSDWSAALNPSQSQKHLNGALEKLLLAAVRHVWDTASESHTEPQGSKAAHPLQQLDDNSTKLREQLNVELTCLFKKCVQHAVQQDKLGGEGNIAKQTAFQGNNDRATAQNDDQVTV